MTDASPAALQKMLAWMSPAFPVGSYTYSHGLEWAITDGDVGDVTSLTAWIGDVLAHGAGRNDAIIFVHAWRAAAASDIPTLVGIAGLATAFQPSRERHLESTAQGRAFLSAVAATWPEPKLLAMAAALSGTPIPYPVALATAAATHSIPIDAMLPGMLAAFVANLASVGVRAIPIGQTDGLRVAAALAPVVLSLAAEAQGSSLDDVGGAALRADIASMRHETQYTRLFRS